HSSRRRANTSTSSASCGPKEACPPSLASTCQRPFAGKRAATTQPGTWTEHDLDTFPHRHELAQRPRLCRAEKRHGPRNRLEIVQHPQLQKSEALRKLAASQPPARAIGKHYLLAADRPGDGQRGRARARTGLLKVTHDSRIQPGDRIIVDDQHALERSGGIA